MPTTELREAISDLLNDYAECIDDDRLEDWPEFFTEHCLYQVLPRENADQGLPIAVIRCDGKAMLEDRVTAYRKANLFAPHTYRHLVGAPRIRAEHGGMITVRSNYALFRTSSDPINYGTSELFSVGEYRDQMTMAENRLLLHQRIVLADTSRIKSLLVTPI